MPRVAFGGSNVRCLTLTMSHVCIAAMFFRDLPRNLNPGRIPLHFVGDPPPSLSTCTLCKLVSPDSRLCEQGHWLCSSCAPMHPANLIWCRLCEGLVPSQQMTVPDVVLESLQLSTNCGFAGTFSAIRDHVPLCQQCRKLPFHEAATTLVIHEGGVD